MVNVQIKVPDWLDRIVTWPVLVYRWWKYGYTFRKIYLGEGKYAIVDQADYYWLKKYRWYIAGNGKEFYAYANIIIGPGKTKFVSMHRLIMNHPPGLLVDHRNNIPLDNRRANLRSATQSQNRQNSKKKKNTTSKYIGVHLDKHTGKWKARLRINGKEKQLGRFVNEEEAAKAYDIAAKQYYGECAKLNFPDDKAQSHPLSVSLRRPRPAKRDSVKLREIQRISGTKVLEIASQFLRGLRQGLRVLCVVAATICG
jgi:hypothetical protein